ncbi:sensor histidine kinase [Nonomuraea sp. NPDC050556]|uniref:sensor histidine kinase n=1 Tax=Nonomuraea sp. NPDC050556 TaxID=3364369 RepID=UPI0037ABEB99
MNLFAWRPPRWLLIHADTVVAVLLALASTAEPPGLTRSTASTLSCWLLVVPVAVRRIWPVPAYCGALVISVLVLALQVNRLMTTVVVALTIYTVATTQPARRSAIALLTGLLVTGGSLLVWVMGAPQRADGWPDPVFVVAMAWLIVGASWSLGTSARTRREYAAREAKRQAEKAVTDERLRIVRELHDVVAHSLSMITVKAGVAAKVLDKHPEEGRRALQTIEEIGRSSLVEMRQFLGALRSPDGVPEHAPQPGLADLPSLADRAAEAGVQVDLSVSGAVPDSMGLPVYRIVQEAVTNVVRHAAPARCQARVSVADGILKISVIDDGPGHRVLPRQPSGHGLTGIRERTMMYGGTFDAGSLPEGGFGVHASWQIGEAASG